MNIETFADDITLYRENNESFSACLTLPEQLAVFEGHFPGKPILPGVAYIFIAEKLVGRFCQKPLKLKSLKKTKFFRPSEPQERLHIQGSVAFNAADENLLDAQVVFCDDQKQRVPLVKMIMEL